MRIAICAVVLSLAASLANAAGPELKTDDQKTLYAIGLALSSNLSTFNLSAADLDLIKAGLTDGALKKQPKVDLQAYGPKIQELHRTRLAAVTEQEKKAGKAYTDKAAKEPGVKKTDSGILYSTIKPGTGESPKATDRKSVV